MYSLCGLGLCLGLFAFVQQVALAEDSNDYFYIYVVDAHDNGYIDVISDGKTVTYKPEAYELLQLKPIPDSAKVCFYGQGKEDSIEIDLETVEGNDESNFELKDSECTVLKDNWDSFGRNFYQFASRMQDRYLSEESHLKQTITRDNVVQSPTSCNEENKDSCMGNSQYIQPGTYEMLIIPLAFFTNKVEDYEGKELTLLMGAAAEKDVKSNDSAISNSVVKQGSVVFPNILVEEGRFYKLQNHSGKIILDMIPMDIESLRTKKLFSEGVLPFSGVSQEQADEIGYYEDTLKSDRDFLYLNALNQLYKYNQ